VPVAFEVAQALHIPLDVFVVRKLGTPWHKQLAVGRLRLKGSKCPISPWHKEILYLEQTHREVYDRLRISQISDNHLRARLYGRPSGNRVSHIKAATFHDLGIKQTPEGFEATVVLDV
jgi:predicted phosphoribosyltransferase